MLTPTMVDAFKALAGDDYMWTGVRGCHRPPATVRRALRLDLIARQGGICPQCGNALDDTAEFCHVVSRGPAVKGWIPGCIFAGHVACNASTKPIHDNDGNVLSGVAVLTVDMFARPDLVPDEWTPFPILRNRNV